MKNFKELNDAAFIASVQAVRDRLCTARSEGDPKGSSEDWTSNSHDLKRLCDWVCDEFCSRTGAEPKRFAYSPDVIARLYLHLRKCNKAVGA